ncbi:MAG: LptA/OstA family protein [Pacificimonas sp.]|jgi:lipopolysaccharide export system protein LptA|nr:LptA/OstA family protein [Pacificimonas sp.]
MGGWFFLAGLLFQGVGLEGTGALAPDSDAPIDLAAERCEVFENEDTARCAGAVRLVQGDAILTADEMTIFGFSHPDGVRRIEGSGNVRYASGPNAISGATAVYDASATTITVTGDVVVIQGDQIMAGGELVYNTATGALQFSPGADGRVRGLFYSAAQRQ